MKSTEVRAQFLRLHEAGCFVMPNPPDAGSARLLEALGFAALATTSSGLAATRGQADMTIDRPLVVEHVGLVAGAIDIPLNVDAERCYSTTVEGIVETVDLLAAAGAAGCSIEDWDPDAGRIDDVGVAVERVAAAASATQRHGMVLTARCEHHIRGIDDFDATLARLAAYKDAGAEVVYAPGLIDPDRLRAVVELGAPVNALLIPGGPTVSELAELGVRRVSVGGLLAWTMYGALAASAQHLLENGTLDPALPFVDRTLMKRVFT